MHVKGKSCGYVTGMQGEDKDIQPIPMRNQNQHMWLVNPLTAILKMIKRLKGIQSVFIKAHVEDVCCLLTV